MIREKVEIEYIKNRGFLEFRRNQKNLEEDMNGERKYLNRVEIKDFLLKKLKEEKAFWSYDKSSAPWIPFLMSR